MTSRILLIIWFILNITFIANISNAQNWELTGAISYTSVQKLPSGKIISCTDAGSLYTSTDEGESWSHQLVNPKRGFFSMKFIDNSHGIIGASPNGFVEMTTDGAKTWEEKYVSDGYIKSLAYPTLDTIYILADPNICYRSVNGGKTFDSLAVPTNHLLNKVVFSNSKNGFLAGDSATLFHTSDAGLTWQKIKLPQTIEGSITTIDISADNTVVIGTFNTQIATSTNNGVSWKVTSFKGVDTLNAPIDLVKIVQPNNIEVFMTGSSYFRLHSSDLGLTWQPYPLFVDRKVNPIIDFSTATDFNDLYVDKDGNGYSVGSWGTLYRIQNFGINTPNKLSFLEHHCSIGIGTFPFTLSDGFLQLESVKNNTNYLHAISQYGHLNYSSDGGGTWFSREDGNYGLNGYFGIHFTSENDGILFVGSDYTVRTTDNGLSWSNVALPVGQYSNSITSQTGELFLFQDSAIYRSVDGGNTTSLFAKYFETTPKDNRRKILLSIIGLGNVFANDTMFIEVTTSDSMFIHTKGFDYTHGISYNLVVTVDSGKHWVKRFVFPDSLYLTGLQFANTQIGIAVLKDTAGRFNICMRTEDGGFNWKVIPNITTPVDFQDFKFSPSGAIGIALGTYGDLWSTKDQGKSWESDTLKYSVNLQDLNAKSSKIVFTDDSTAVIISDVGFWKKTFPVTKSTVENSGAVSNQYLDISLYPVPAYGTAIHCTLYGLYSVLPASVNVRIVDLLGRVVLDLSAVAKNKNNGAFSSFDIPTSSLPNGVYSLLLATSHGATAKNIIIMK